MINVDIIYSNWRVPAHINVCVSLCTCILLCVSVYIDDVRPCVILTVLSCVCMSLKYTLYIFLYVSLCVRVYFSP